VKIVRTPTTHGVQSRLEYRYAGGRYRPVLGYDLTSDQERDEAHRLITTIHLNARGGASAQVTPGQRFDGFAGQYLAFLRSKKLKDIGRPATILGKHLVPFFGSIALGSIQLDHGLRYLEHRRSQKAAEGTIERECNVLLGMLNHAVATDVLDKNRLALLPSPQGDKRERVAEPWELWRILWMNSAAIGRMLLLGLQVPLRQQKLIEAHSEWLIQRSDGWWMMPSAGSRLKRVPKSAPVNRLGFEMLHGEERRISGRFFEQWKNGNSFKHRWIDGCNRAGILDLHFHDLRHTSLSWLLEAGVDYAVVQRLAGHKILGMTESYLHLWESRLREAVTILERVTIQKLQAAVNDERCIMPATKGGQLGGRRAVVGSSWAVGRVMEACKSAEEWCRGTESNCRHQPFQGCALPTELPRHGVERVALLQD
jgi:integrase